MNKTMKIILLCLTVVLLATMVYAYKINGDMEVTGKVTTEKVEFEVDSTNHFIEDNATCTIIHGDTSEFAVC